MDCAGPYRVKRGRTYELHYMLLLTCAKTRAVRLEVLHSLSMDSLLLALSRVRQRGVQPKLVITDNGTNFKGAHNLLEKLQEVATEKKMEEALPHIRWLFNPPLASHFGGLFERLIRSAKRALYHALPAHLSLTLEELQTAFAQVEGALNNRPLAYVGNEEDATPITPNHFLYGSASQPAFPTVEEVEALGGEGRQASRWQKIRKIAEHFWKQLQQQLWPLYQDRREGGREMPPLRVGEIVTFLHPTRAAKWPLARIVQVHPGRDGKIRVITLRTCGEGGGTYVRDVAKVAKLLPVEQQEVAAPAAPLPTH